MDHSNARNRDAVALTFAAFLPLVLAYLYFIVLVDPRLDLKAAWQWAFSVGKSIQFLLPITYVWWFERDRLGIPRPTFRGMGFGVGFGLIVAAGMFALYFGFLKDLPALANDTPAAIHKKVIQFNADSPLGFLRMAVGISVVHSLFEEYYWRWFLFGWMRRHMPTAAAAVLSALAFMLHHIVILYVYFPGHFWTLALPFSMCVAVGGGFWAWLYARGGSLYAPWLSHCLIDAAIMGVGYAMLAPRYWH